MPTCHILGAEEFAPILESQNTQSPSLSFRTLLTEGGDPRVNMHGEPEARVAGQEGCAVGADTLM